MVPHRRERGREDGVGAAAAAAETEDAPSGAASHRGALSKTDLASSSHPFQDAFMTFPSSTKLMVPFITNSPGWRGPSPQGQAC